MAISQLPQAPYRQDRKTFPTALSTDVIFSEIRDCSRIDFPEYGTPHPSATKWPDHKLVFIKTVDIERDGIFEFFYAANRENQDLYNFAFGFRNLIGNVGGREFRTIQRTYVTSRESFAPYDIPFGTPMPNIPEDKFEGVNYVFFDRQQQKIDVAELDSLYVIEVHTYVETAFLDYKLSYSTQRDDGLPEKFKVQIPQEQTEEIVEGLAEMPVLASGELSSSEDQLNPDVKLVKKLTRNIDGTPVLTGKIVTNVLQVAGVEESIVDDGETITASALTVDGSVESLGNGKSVKRVITAPDLFKAESFTTQRPDAVPEKFRVAIPTTTVEENVEGTAAQPILTTGELVASEQQVNKFVKRTQKTKRNPNGATVLTQKATDNTKLLATVTETYQTGDTTVVPSALVDVTSEALGDGTYIVRKVEVPEVFQAATLSVEKPDFIPLKFQATIPSVTTDVTEAGTAVMPNLSGDDLAASEQQVNKFVKRTQRKTRAIPSNATLAGSEFNQAISYVTSEELVDIGTPSATGSTVVESSVTPIGGGKALRTVKSVANGAYSSSNPATRRIENRVTPLETDIIFIEIGAMPTPAPEYGTPHYSPNQWPNHKLVLIKPAGRDGILYEFYYAADRENQDDYNLVDQNNGQFLVRSYIIPRADFYNRSVYALTVPVVGVSPDPVFGANDPIYGDFVFSGESVKHTGTELDSLYVEVERMYQLKEEVTYDFNNNLEVNFKITKRIVARDSPTTASKIGKIVERQNMNAWHDIETITELDERDNYFDANGKFIPIVLPDVPKDVQFNFPNLLNFVDITVAPSADALDYIINYDMVSPPSGPFEARVMRIITDDPDYYRTLYPVVNLHPKRELINTSATTYRDQQISETLTIVRDNISCRQTEVPPSVHGDIDIDIDLISQRLNNPLVWEQVTNIVTDSSTNLKTLYYNYSGAALFQVQAMLPKTSDYYLLTGGGELVVGYDVTKVDLNLYNVSIIFLNIDGLYNGDSDSAYDGRTRQQVFLSAGTVWNPVSNPSGTGIPCRLSYTYSFYYGNATLIITADLFEFRLQTPYGDIVDTGFKRVITNNLGQFTNSEDFYALIQTRLTIALENARAYYIAHVVKKLKTSFLSKKYLITSNDSGITLKSLSAMENLENITMSFNSNYATVSSYLGGNVLIPRGGGPTITSTSTLIPS